ncbi:type VII secretion protein EccB, partial [Mycolicibacterium insubricum]|uniref:type VII secretion protein EccB n=1 Tax=Mycolicibacterium insubricum TaxID=444597 RepID=UPI003908A8E9
AGTDVVLADRASSALYVRVNDQLHPVLNLASARLIAGKPVSPKAVNARQLDKFGRGPLIGIPGAPERMVANTRPTPTGRSARAPRPPVRRRASA